jgi:hypothetical protein
MQTITREVQNGTTYLTAEYRGTMYTLCRGQFGWELSTRRIALGRFNAGGFKRFDTLAQAAASCKAFAEVEIFEAL